MSEWNEQFLILRHEVLAHLSTHVSSGRLGSVHPFSFEITAEMLLLRNSLS
jgi:hypothetical protein